MRIKVINPNTTQSMTEKIAQAARAAAPASEIIAVSPGMGPVSVESAYDEALSLPGVLAEVRRGEVQGVDGFVIACFGDPGLHAARELTSAPVIGIAEAAMHAASMLANHFSIVTTLCRSIGTAEHLLEAYGMKRFCRGVRAAEVAVLDLEEPGSLAQAKVFEECRRALREDGTDAIVLGCAGMADLCADFSQRLGVPVIDGVSVAVRWVEALAGIGLSTSKRGAYARPPAKPMTGMLADFSLAQR